MKQILLTTDFSKNATNAIQYALQLFENDPCNFIILNTQNPTAYISDDLVVVGYKSLYDTIVESTKQKLETLLAGLKKEFKTTNFNFELVVDYDTLSEAINQILASRPIDLILMGTNGVTGAQEVLFGSNTINVIRKVHCPTLIIPNGYTYVAPKEVLLPLDNADSLSSSAFLKLAEFTKRYSKKLHILRIAPENENPLKANEDLPQLNTLLSDIEHDYHHIEDISMSTAVDCYTQTHHIDLIALLVQDESFFERLFLSSTTTKINNRLKVPLLVLHS